MIHFFSDKKSYLNQTICYCNIVSLQHIIILSDMIIKATGLPTCYLANICIDLCFFFFDSVKWLEEKMTIMSISQSYNTL
jgi:hypothetical protein